MNPIKIWRVFIHRLTTDESGILTFEYILIGTLLIIGIVAGLAVMRDMVIFKMTDFAGAFGNLDQSCGFEAVPGPDGHDECLYLQGGVYVDGKTAINFVSPAELDEDP